MPRSYPVMTLVAEHQLTEFLTPPKGSGVLEASGVVAKGAHDYVIDSDRSVFGFRIAIP